MYRYTQVQNKHAPRRLLVSRGHDSVVLHDDVSIVMTFFICSQVKMDIEKSVETLKFDMSAVLLLGQNPTRHDTTRHARLFTGRGV